MTSSQHDFTTEVSSQPIYLRRPILAAICLAALVASAIVMPMCFLGSASGHDFQPHVASWIEANSQWRQGIIFPRWAQWANSGFGEPRFVFYPPASWMLGAALGSILPWRMVPAVFIWLAIFCAAMSMWKLAREWLPANHALAAAILFAANPYHLALAYYRSDFAELLASAIFPLMLCGAFGIFRHGWRRVPLLAISFAAIWLSNAPAGVIASYSLALILVIACIVARSIHPLIWGSLAMIAGFGLAAFYLVPAWSEQPSVLIANAVSTTYDPQQNFLFSRISDPDFLLFNRKISTLALGVIILTVLGIAFSFKQRAAWSKVWWLLVALSAASVFLMLPPSALLWRHLPELKFLQFPWRWLLALNLGFAFFAAAVRSKRWQWLWCLTLLCALWATGTTIAGDTSWDSEDVPTLVEAVRAGRGYEGIEGFQPRDAKVDELDDEAPLVGEYDPESGDVEEPEDAQINIQSWTAEKKHFQVTSDEPIILGLKLLNYPAWEVRVDGKAMSAESSPQTGQIILPLEGGTHQVEVGFQHTRDQTIGLLISVLFGVGLLAPVGLALALARRRSSSHEVSH
jgi:hypothetical protein